MINPASASCSTSSTPASDIANPMDAHRVPSPHAAPHNGGLWFEDGNLILQAENTLFKIYRGHLASRSSVFADMFAFPIPAEGNHVLDGVPIVEVYDTATDMEYFLKAILDSEFFEPPPTPTTLDIVTSVLRLATKYDVAYLRSRALAHLLSTYPTTLEGWKARDTVRTIPGVENTPFAALSTATEFDLPWLVPSIVYCISSHDMAKTLDGAEWADGTLELSWADKKRCLVARNRILITQNAHALNIIKSRLPAAGADQPPCTEETPGECAETRMKCADILTRWGTAGFLDFWDEQAPVMAKSFCPACLQSFEALQQRTVAALWEELPKFCGLPEWRELERIRRLGSSGGARRGSVSVP